MMCKKLFSCLHNSFFFYRVRSVTQNNLYLLPRILRAFLSFSGSYFVQIYLIHSYPLYVNASAQVALKLIALQGFFTSGFSILILSHPSSYRTYLYRHRHAYWLSIATKFILILASAALFFSFSQLRNKLQLNYLFTPLLFLFLLGLLGGDGQAYAYANKKSGRYESFIVVLQAAFFLFLGALVVIKQPSQSWAAILSFTCLLLPKYTADLLFSAKAYPSFLLFRAPTKVTLRTYSKAFSSSLLLGVAFLNWSLDVLLVAILGDAQGVSMLSLFTLIFSIPQILVGFLSPSIQLRWSKSQSIKCINRDLLIVAFSLCSLTFLIALLYWALSLTMPGFFPINPYIAPSLYILVALSSLAGCFSTLIGLLMNSRLMIGRQVLLIGILVTPFNFFLSFVLFPYYGVGGIVFATFMSQLLTMVINLGSIIRGTSSMYRP